MPGRRTPLRLATPLLAAALLGTVLTAEHARAAVPEAVWLIEFTDDRAADAQRTRLAEAADGLDYELRSDFRRLWNGVSVSADAATARRLERLDAVERVWPVTTVAIPRDAAREPELALAVETTRAADARRRGLDGDGVAVGIIDTGIDYTHPDLGGCFGAGCRVAFGTDFVGDDFDADEPETSEPEPDDDPADCNGHGTHVAGIVGASGEATGVAPGVTFGAYKVFGCEGTTTSEVILQALEAAHRDGMDIVNLSLGQAFQWPGYPTSKAADALVAEGVVVVASIGNAGASGVQSASAPGVGADVIGVASTDNEAARMRAARVAPTGDTIGFNVIGDTAEPEAGTVTDPLVWFGRACEDDEPEGDVDGRAALITRGGCTFTEKYERAVDAGATAVVVHNDRPGPFGGTGPEDLGPILVGVTAADGKNLRDLAEIGAEPTIEFTDGTVLVDLPFAGLASDFTSYGPTPDLAFKPDLAAPGGGIWSTYPVDQGSYRSASGTSMSAPHVSGAAALLLQAEPWLSAESVRTRLANTAAPIAWRDNPGLGYLEAVHRQGTGVIDMVAALDAEGAFGPVRVELGHGFGPRTVELEIVSQSKRTTAYAFAHEPAMATTGDIRATDFNVAAATVEFEPEAVVLAPGRRAAVTVTITPNAALPEGSVFGGRLVAMPANGGSELAAAYMGYHGDYLDRVVLDHDEYPKLAVELEPDEAEEADEEFRDIADGEVFSLSEGPLPSALMFFAYQPAALEVAFEHLDTGDRVELDREWFVVRSPGPDDTIVFDLESFHEEFPEAFAPGDWVMEVRVLKALGDEENPAHWEGWRSPAFTLVE